jgi:hypothetical protein
MRSIIGPLEAAGWQVRIERFPSGRYGVRTWERRALLRWADVVVLHQIKLSAIEARLMAALSRRRIFDVDDAIYVRKPRRLGGPVNDSIWRRGKFQATCRWVDVVAAGNDVLAGVARRAARDIVILPTSIDTSAYAARHPTLKMRVICSKFPDWPEIRVERVPWRSETEAASLAGAHIGVMPLTDDEWARGKCAFKLLQYMAASLPCVASPVGANTEAVVDGVNGFHARDTDEWERNLGRLIDSADLRARFGASGHAHVEERYAMGAYQTNYVALLTRLAAGRSAR